ncbi:hypothetical protein Micbo1qcDRAFT_218639 [Microdochium bolleyi]|uniref:Uncharacterized protein n=1 Tax=Microdochium bolleyi TaxID=196109 RepID=A0A136IPN0_9PEZI|nr:hypothetical protein Micbo1qcDRAFT_218639 [Microdochium bolleyi]
MSEIDPNEAGASTGKQPDQSGRHDPLRAPGGKKIKLQPTSENLAVYTAMRDRYEADKLKDLATSSTRLTLVHNSSPERDASILPTILPQQENRSLPEQHLDRSTNTAESLSSRLNRLFAPSTIAERFEATLVRKLGLACDDHNARKVKHGGVQSRAWSTVRRQWAYVGMVEWSSI